VLAQERALVDITLAFKRLPHLTFCAKITQLGHKTAILNTMGLDQNK
jgi:hypothetical protein